MEKIILTDHVRNEEVLLRVKAQRNILHEILVSKRKANWIGHILRRNGLLWHVIKGMINGGIKVTERRGRRRKNLLDHLKERRGYSHLKEEALDRTMWRARFGRGFRSVVRQTTKWLNESNSCTALDRPGVFQEIEAPRFQDNRHMKVISLSAVGTSSRYTPGNIPGTHLC
jgi:hypothetical protein